MFKKVLFIFLLWGMFPFWGLAQEEETQSVFIPVYRNFDFAQSAIVDEDNGDITILYDGIETTTLKTEIASLKKGFIEDIKVLPEEAEIEWRHFVDYEIGMIYAVKRSDGKYALFELIEVNVSDEEVLGVEIDYKYQPDGGREF